MRSNRRAKDALSNIYKKLYKFYGPQGWWPARTPLEVITGAILTQNTAWTNVEKAIKSLKKAGVLSSASKLKEIEAAKLASLIRPAGYYNVKSKRLKNFVNFLFAEFGGSLDRLACLETKALRDKLLGVNGVGPETCDSILLYAFKRPVFVVDAYTKRLLSRHSLCREGAGYDEMQGLFMKHLPVSEKLYNEYHALIVRLGKDFCRKNRSCRGCPLKA